MQKNKTRIVFILPDADELLINELKLFFIKTKKKLKRLFTISDLGNVNCFLEMKVEDNGKELHIF